MKLSNKISVYVPSTTDGDKPAKGLQKRQTRHALKRFSILFGGATATDGIGSWYDKEKKQTIFEPVKIVYANCTDEDLTSKAEQVRTLAEMIKKTMRQQAVTIETNNEIQFI